MALRDISIMFREMAAHMYRTFIGFFKSEKDSSLLEKVIWYAVFFGLIGWGGKTAYSFYIDSREQVAHAAFHESTLEYERALSTEGDQDWASIAMLFKTGYKENSNSNLAPYFLVYQAEALIKQDKKSEALKVMDKAVIELGDAPIAPLYQAKRALMQVDSGDAALKTQGLATLKELANDKNNIYSDSAAYHLGSYYLAKGDIAQAKLAWKPLAEQQLKDIKKSSLWARLAQQKLQQLH